VTRSKRRIPVLDFLKLVHWLDGTPILPRIEAYRRRILTDVLDTPDDAGGLRYNLALLGRAKKNAKSLDLVLAALFACFANDAALGNECYVIASDEGQARDDLQLAKKLVAVSPHLKARCRVLDKSLVRTDGRGFVMILPGQDVAGSHGKSYRFCGLDEIHTQRTWDLLEAMQLDPHRPDAQQWITSYASIYHRPGIPLFDLLAQGKRGDDPKMYLSWYGADFSTDPQAQPLDPEHRANPSIASFAATYLAQQRRRLPAHVYRRLHLNLPGLPQGSAFTAEAVMDAVARGVRVRPPEPGVVYHAFIDPAGGSNDAMTCGISYQDPEGRAVLARVLDQGQAPPFDPRAAVDRFAGVLGAYRITRVVGDAYAGQTFAQDFLRHGIIYEVAGLTASKCYEHFEPALNGNRIVLLDHPVCEAELLGLVWRGGKIDHLPGEHDVHANAAVGACLLALAGDAPVDTTLTDDEARAIRRIFSHPGDLGVDADDVVGNFLDPARW
jgi:hypothetical protein